MECPFCDASNLNLRKFYENGLFIALYNIRPVTEGHCLVIPKRHVESFISLNDEEKKGLSSFVGRSIFMALKFANAYQFDLTLQEGKDAGQSVSHTHLHIIPRKKDDFLSPKTRWLSVPEHDFGSVNPPLTKEETERIVKKLRLIAKEHAVQIETI